MFQFLNLNGALSSSYNLTNNTLIDKQNSLRSRETIKYTYLYRSEYHTKRLWTVSAMIKLENISKQKTEVL